MLIPENRSNSRTCSPIQIAQVLRLEDVGGIAFSEYLHSWDRTGRGQNGERWKELVIQSGSDEGCRASGIFARQFGLISLPPRAQAGCENICHAAFLSEIGSNLSPRYLRRSLARIRGPGRS